ncbi:MAG: GNAT family N-acetyltransferase [Lutibacter sp.]|jgi:hypothetical protein
MNNLKPINLDNGVIQIHPLRSSDLIQNDKLVNDLFEIFGDEKTLPFNEEKIIKDKVNISNHLLGVTYGYQEQLRFTHFLTLKPINKTIGQIIILSPKSIESVYNIENTWFIEFYLNKMLWNNGVMTDALAGIISNMQEQGIVKIGALVKRENQPSIRVLEKTGFKKIRVFDLKQDYYEISN